MTFIASSAEVDTVAADKMATGGVARIPPEGPIELQPVHSVPHQHRMELKELHEDLKRQFRMALSKKSSG